MAHRPRSLDLAFLLVVAAGAGLAPRPAAAQTGWYFQTSPTTQTLNDVQALDSGTAVAVGLGGTILKTADGGTTWAALASGTTLALNGVHFLDASNGWAVGATILRTVNGGTTWTPQTGAFTTLQDVRFLSASVGVAVGSVGSQGFLRTTNGGDTWTALDIGSTGTNRPQALFFLDALRGFAVGLNANMITTTCDAWGQCTTTYSVPKSVIWKTTDGGVSWGPYIYQTGLVRFLRGVAFVDELTGWAVGDSGMVLKTTDGGASWVAQTSGTTTNLYSTAFVSATTGWIVGVDGVIRKTSDGGTSWTEQGTASSALRSVSFADATNGWGVGAGGKIVRTTDAGGAGCTYALSPTEVSFPGGGGSGSLTVTAPGLCGWTAASDSPWLAIGPGGTSGAGNGTIGYSMGYNLTGLPRTGHITVQGQALTVEQSACGTPTYTLSPPSASFPSEGGAGAFAVTLSGPGCWTATSDKSWLTVTSGGSGLENGTVGYRVEPNVTTSFRIGHVTVAGETFTLSQASCGPACPALTVSTWAGTAGQWGSIDGTGPAARFYYPRGVAVDSHGNGYVADSENHTIRKISPAGEVTTLAGTAGQAGSTDAAGAAARFRYPRGVAVDAEGNVYVGDTDNHTIRRITPSGEVTTVAGSAGAWGTADGTGAAARFYSPIGLAFDPAGNLLVGDSSNHTIRKMSPAGEVTTLAGLAGTSGSADGTGSAARFFYPYGVAVDSAGDVWVADSSNGAVRKVSPEGVVTTLATGLAGPYGVATAPSGAVYVSNTNQYDIRRVYPVLGAVPVAGLAGNSGSADGTGTVARFFLPALIAADSAGNVYVADRFNHTIRRATPPASLAMAASSGDGQSAPAGTAVPVAPSVVVRDDQANPVAGVPVRFAVASGGGSVTGATPTTGADGVATVGSWTLGGAPGPNTLTASASWVSGSPVTFAATALETPSLAVNDVSVSEGHAGSGATATFTVTLSVASPLAVTVAYSTANGTAVAGSDYVAASGILTVPAGSTTGSIPVAVIGDAAVEPDETFFVNLASPTHAILADAQGVGTIRNDDSPDVGATSFYTLTPCRMVDTRNPAGEFGGPALQPGAQRAFTLAGPKCGIPSTARAVSMNVTVTGGTAPGNIRLFPTGVAAPLVSMLNFGAGQTRANNAIVSLGATPAGSLVVLNASAGAVHFILDVNGYFE